MSLDSAQHRGRARPQGYLWLPRAVTVLRRGGVIAYPTEGVWGLGCDPFNRNAVERVLALKGRSERKGLILLATDIDQFAPWLSGLTLQQRKTLAESWPAALTWLVPDNGYSPPWLTGCHASIALRVSAHPLARELARMFGGPVVSTSANPQGRLAAISQLRARIYFGNRVDFYLPGQVLHPRQASEIRDLASGRVIRARPDRPPSTSPGPFPEVFPGTSTKKI